MMALRKRHLWLADLENLCADVTDATRMYIGLREPNKDKVDGDGVYRALRIVELTWPGAERMAAFQKAGFKWVIVTRADIIEGQI